jgi:hypothetical protein
VVFTLHANDATKLAAAKERLQTALTLSNEVVPRLPLFYDTIEGLPA